MTFTQPFKLATSKRAKQRAVLRASSGSAPSVSSTNTISTVKVQKNKPARLSVRIPTVKASRKPTKRNNLVAQGTTQVGHDSPKKRIKVKKVGKKANKSKKAISSNESELLRYIVSQAQWCTTFNIGRANNSASFTPHAHLQFRDSNSDAVGCDSTGLQSTANHVRISNPNKFCRTMHAHIDLKQFPFVVVAAVEDTGGTPVNSQHGFRIRSAHTPNSRAFTYSFDGSCADGLVSFPVPSVRSSDVVVLLGMPHGVVKVCVNGEVHCTSYTAPLPPWELSWFSNRHGAQLRLLQPSELRSDWRLRGASTNQEAAFWQLSGGRLQLAPSTSPPATCRVTVDCNSDDDPVVRKNLQRLKLYLDASIGVHAVTVVENQFGLSRMFAGSFEVYASIAVEGKQSFHQVMLHSRLKSSNWPNFEQLGEHLESLFQLSQRRPNGVLGARVLTYEEHCERQLTHFRQGLSS